MDEIAGLLRDISLDSCAFAKIVVPICGGVASAPRMDAANYRIGELRGFLTRHDRGLVASVEPGMARLARHAEALARCLNPPLADGLLYFVVTDGGFSSLEVRWERRRAADGR